MNVLEKTEGDRAADRHELFEELELKVDFTFIPFGQSKHCKDSTANWWKEPNWPSLNWRCVVNVKGRPVLITDYAQGIGHVPGWHAGTQRMTIFAAGVMGETISTGRVPMHRGPHVAKVGKVPEPSREDVMYSLLSDGAADFDAMSFRDWCADYGYDDDSMKAKATYDECVDIGRKLRGAIGPKTIERLREAYEDY